MVSGKRWGDGGFRTTFAQRGLMKVTGAVLVALVGIQLVFGAFMRHYHRVGVADDGLLRTQGAWIPDFHDPVIAALFLHKFNAFCIFFFVIGMLIRFSRKDWDQRGFRYMITIFAILCVQIILGLGVIGTDKSFWVTNVHVLNGLAVLALSFAFSVLSWRGQESRESLA